MPCRILVCVVTMGLYGVSSGCWGGLACCSVIKMGVLLMVHSEVSLVPLEFGSSRLACRRVEGACVIFCECFKTVPWEW
ncbi:hypothetical protein HBH56_151020 [Parastagonospora nodorum]|uniref:Uncharacterized protein n=1 Tax=Phaeosphaeria nodorum (strain SN15 / ATCC MYA-4574 / FGSC 10173) TaxID=321614 RepID=A0A7U2EX36_PHANO|nr:hypothetical protein HBH56_151020 [Parastagonospora nodorum]QRC94312.1 hypothetical protein JI435_405590 [Parastagonospora nodorum SN15]KAH3928442.1 hypothetical protein HBH54_136920 [Parastagonospora nodorum]KAH4128571.1 hypothetical protein HBH47_032800 [Parastagonospora nodorum]KAH4142603.1 hypothetical protein HBH45_053290 [Parastagonospora nodorum]